jgi:hypothetical protein
MTRYNLNVNILTGGNLDVDRTSWSQSYDFEIYNYNASVIVCSLVRFFNVEENIFVFKTH